MDLNETWFGGGSRIRKNLNKQFHENQSNGNRVVLCWRTDGQRDYENNIIFLQFCEAHYETGFKQKKPLIIHTWPSVTVGQSVQWLGHVLGNLQTVVWFQVEKRRSSRQTLQPALWTVTAMNQMFRQFRFIERIKPVKQEMTYKIRHY